MRELNRINRIEQHFSCSALHDSGVDVTAFNDLLLIMLL